MEPELPAYVIFDSGYYWGVTGYELNINYLGMLPTSDDEPVYIKSPSNNGNVVVDVISRNYVNGGINAGNDRFQQLSNHILESFEIKPQVLTIMTFTERIPGLCRLTSSALTSVATLPIFQRSR